MAFKRKEKIDPTGVYVAVQSFATEQSSFAKGARLRGSHAVVKAHPELFLPDGSTDEDFAAALGAVYGEPAPYVDTGAPTHPQELTLGHPHALVVTRDASFPMGRDLWLLRPGDLVDDRDARTAAAKRLPQGKGLFRKPTAEERR